jgi:hypothetical protein
MKFKIILCFLIFAFNATAQNKIYSRDIYYLCGGQTLDCYIYSDEANVRSGAGMEFEILDKLICGQKVKVLLELDVKDTINGVSAYWVKISYRKNNKIKEGYLWQGNLSYNNLKSADSTIFVFGVENNIKIKRFDDYLKQEYEYDAYLAKIKAVKNGNIISSKSFKVNETNLIYGQIINNVLLDSVKSVIEITFGGGACGLPNDDFYFVWTGSEIIHLIDTYSIAEAGIAGYSETLILPMQLSEYQQSSCYNIIIKLINHHEYNDDATELSVDNYKTELYRWNGKKLIKFNQNWK